MKVSLFLHRQKSIFLMTRLIYKLATLSFHGEWLKYYTITDSVHHRSWLNTDEPHLGKTGLLPMGIHRPRSVTAVTVQMISTLVFASWVVQ